MRHLLTKLIDRFARTEMRLATCLLVVLVVISYTGDKAALLATYPFTIAGSGLGAIFMSVVAWRAWAGRYDTAACWVSGAVASTLWFIHAEEVMWFLNQLAEHYGWSDYMVSGIEDYVVVPLKLFAGISAAFHTVGGAHYLFGLSLKQVPNVSWFLVALVFALYPLVVTVFS